MAIAKFYDTIMEGRQTKSIKLWQSSLKRGSEKFNGRLVGGYHPCDHGRDAKTGKDHGGQSEREQHMDCTQLQKKFEWTI